VLVFVLRFMLTQYCPFRRICKLSLLGCVVATLMDIMYKLVWVCHR